MAGYVPWYGKKRVRLLEQERAFLALLHSGAAPSKLAEGADAVRKAHIRMLKARQAQLPPSGKNTAVVADLDRRIDYWQNLSSAAIVGAYRSAAPRRRLRRARHAAL